MCSVGVLFGVRQFPDGPLVIVIALDLMTRRTAAPEEVFRENISIRVILHDHDYTLFNIIGVPTGTRAIR